ncbi:MAG: hypothetical protein VB085_06950 [Peptococcaceae bacterium]|nr:hypothetical protein [Peptococcaceae bacterium]
MLTVIVLFLFSAVMVIESLTARKGAGLKKAGKQIKIMYYFMMLASFCILLLYSLEIPVPSPAKGITGLLDAVFRLVK